MATVGPPSHDRIIDVRGPLVVVGCTCEGWEYHIRARSGCKALAIESHAAHVRAVSS